MIDKDQLREAIALREQGSGVVGMYEAGELVLEAARLVADPDTPEMWICLVDAEFSCNGYLSGGITDPEAHAGCGQFALVRIAESPVAALRGTTE